jgi:hypothetical protein
MESGDQEEAQRLREVYAEMLDGELLALARQVHELTDVARPVLQAELDKRGLCAEPKIAPHAVPEPPDELELVHAHTASDVTEAARIKGILETIGIPCFIGEAGEDGVPLAVRAMDRQRARAVLNQVLPPEPEPDVDFVPACPKCQSPEILFEGEGEWSCDACGHVWKDE